MKTHSIQELKTAEDFNELLTLKDLATQIKVLDFLNNNIESYKRNLLKNNIDTLHNLKNRISKSDINNWIVVYNAELLFDDEKGACYNENEWRSYTNEAKNSKNSIESFENIISEILSIDKVDKTYDNEQFVFDFKHKKLIHIVDFANASFISTVKDDVITFKSKYETKAFYKGLYRHASWNEACQETTISFDVVTNSILSVKQKTSIKTAKKSKSW